MVDAILFDLGDTIINFGIGRKEAEVFFKRGARLSYDHLAAHGRALPAYEHYFKTHYRLMQRAYIWSKITKRDFNYEDVLARVAKALKIPLNSAELREVAWRWYLPIADSSDIDPGVHAMLETLRAAGTKMALVSNTLVPGYCMDRHLDSTGLLPFFPVRIYSSHTRFRKPHPRIFEIALEALGVKADKAIFVGDLLKADIGGGRRMGMRTVWKPARSARASSPKPRHTPTHTIARITQLPDILPHMGWHAGLVEAV
jgi:HAD superfamily hydrolase (TIGR01509 family)